MVEMRRYRMVVEIEVEFEEDEVEDLFDTQTEPEILEKLRRAIVENDNDALEDIRTAIDFSKLADYYQSSEINELELVEGEFEEEEEDEEEEDY
jgi:hypothetical protein